MVITSLVENTSLRGMPVEHGLSLYVSLRDGRRILFDMGQRRLFIDNAARLGIDLSDVDLAIISHGHYDHGGGLRAFLSVNSKAKVYVSRFAFETHYSLRQEGLKSIGLDKELEDNGRLVSCEGVTPLGDGLWLFDGVKGTRLQPKGNRLLFGPTSDENDDFRHEQSLVIKEGDNVVLLAGCAHAGIVNIVERGVQVMGTPFTHVLSGFHLVKSGLEESAERKFIHELARALGAYPHCSYVTMHCTGMPQYELLKENMGDAIHYLACGDSIEI